MIAIIGGTGLGEALGTLGSGKRHEVDTPFGTPSAPIVVTELAGVPLAHLARHGEGHLLNPSRVPYRANIFALKKLGVTHILATGAVGSLREELKPRDLVVPDQVIDRTYRRASTFYEELAVHVEFAAPFCPQLRAALLGAGEAHPRGTYACMEGPQFSTRAESELHRSWGADLIGMTALPEAKLAREAEICYALVALVTDYDCWRPRREAVDQLRLLDEIIANVRAATASALALLRSALPAAQELMKTKCACRSALSLAIWSDKARIPAADRERLGPLIGRYL